MFTQIFTASTGALLPLCLLLVSCRSEKEWQDTTPQTHIVEIKDFSFVPQTISVSPGDTIRWINRDFVPHTATDEEGGWDSEQLDENDTWSLVADTAVSYYCVFHPAMKGNVEVFDQ